MTWGEDYAASQSALARGLAVVALAGKTRLGVPPETARDHARRVAEQFPPGPARCAGWLHDVVEDTNVTSGDLLDAGVDELVVHAVMLLTHSGDGITLDEYLDYVRRIVEHASRTEAGRVALDVKCADVSDNIVGLSRLDAGGYTRLAERLRERYFKAAAELAKGRP